VAELPFKLNNKLFKRYLNSFNFTDEELSPQKSNFSTLYSDSKLEELSLFMSQVKTKQQWLETKFAIHLEDYSKSFQVTYKVESLYSELKNFLDIPSPIKSTKKGDIIIYENELKKYKKQSNLDMELVNQLKVNHLSSKDLALEIKKRQTREAKQELAKMYLNSKFKEFEQSENIINGRKLRVACEYYKIAEAVCRVFDDEKSLLKKVKTDFELILKHLQFQTGKI